ncbi:MAG TPA: hypothetical protein VF695_08100 [Sphingomonas sp.]|jgi:hypothetical protein
MAKISALDLLAAADGTEQVPVVKAGRARRMTVQALASSIVPLLQSWYKGDKGDPGATGNVAVGRGADAAGLKGAKAAVAPVGDVWELSEDGRDGRFKMRAGVPPLPDPDEGIYVVVNGTRYWERIVILAGLPGGATYSASWWGVAAGFVDSPLTITADYGVGGLGNLTTSRTLHRIMTLLPDVAKIIFPPSPKSNPIKIAGLIRTGQKSISAVGHGTWFTGIGAARAEGAGMFHLLGRDMVWDGLNFCDFDTGVGHTPPPCIVVGGINFANQANDNGVANITIRNCIFEDIGAGVITYDSTWKRTAVDGYQRTKRVFVRNCLFKRCSFTYVSFYGVEDFAFEQNTVTCIYKQTGFTDYGCRVIGSKDGQIAGNKLFGPGFTGTSYGSGNGRAITVAEADTNIAGNLPTPCENIMVQDNYANGWAQFVEAASRVDSLVIQQNQAINSKLPTDASAPYQTSFVKVAGAADVGDVIARDNTVSGYDALYVVVYGTIRSWIWERNNFVSVGRSSQPEAGLASLRGVDCSNIQIKHNRTAYPATSVAFSFPEAPATTYGEIWDNGCPEHLWPVGSGNRANARLIGGGAGAQGMFVTSPGGTPQPFVSDFIQDDGTNYRAADGAWIKQTRDPKPGFQ